LSKNKTFGFLSVFLFFWFVDRVLRLFSNLLLSQGESENSYQGGGGKIRRGKCSFGPKEKDQVE